MTKHLLSLDPAFDPASQRLVGIWAAQLDDQLDILEHVVAGLGVADLEWQPRPGVNTIGMLLAHLAVVEAYWIQAVAGDQHDDADRVVRRCIGIGTADDGMPLAADGQHPQSLAGREPDTYLGLLKAARRATHEVLRSWHDHQLDQTCEIEKHTVSRAWIVYHVLEHFCCHLGQIRVLKRDRKQSLEPSVDSGGSA